jgi:hypothetical protein
MKVYSDLKTKRGCPKDSSPPSPCLSFSPTLTSLSVDHCPQRSTATGIIKKKKKDLTLGINLDLSGEEAGSMMEQVNSTMIHCKNFCKCHNVPPVQQ